MFSPKSLLIDFVSSHPIFWFINADLCFKTSFSCSVHSLFLCFSPFADTNSSLSVVSIRLFSIWYQGLCHPDNFNLNLLLANIKLTVLCLFSASLLPALPPTMNKKSRTSASQDQRSRVSLILLVIDVKW